MLRIMSVALASLVLSACGTAPRHEGAIPRSSRHSLTEEEIRASRSSGWTAYELIAQLRPEFLRNRGHTSLRDAPPPTAVVYIDNIRYGDLTTLRSVSIDQIRLIQYIGASDATTRFGTDHSGGAILITTK